MGITGLIPFLEKASCPINLRQYKGQTVAVDAYCWLHRGIFSCAEKIARGEKCDAYITYCLKYVNMLISHDIKPILVFDGRYLPAKAATEKKRRQSREQNRAKAAEFLRQGRTAEARRCLRNSVDVGPEMAVAVARACRSVGADCIVAPYEADAQLAYLNRKGIVTAVITEDSDLILFGCLRVIFKLDLYGSGLEVVQDRLHLAMGVSPERFSMDRFRQMCILSGCDYLSSLPGIGLAKAKKFVITTSSPDISQALGKLPSALGMYSLSVTEEYVKEFMKADATFLYQLVYDPIKRCTVPLNDPKEVSLHAELAETVQGECLASDTEFQLAIGNMDPFHLKLIDDFCPNGPKGQWGGGIGKNGPPKRKWKSIWDKNFVPYGDCKNFNSQDYLMKVDRDSTFGKEAIMSVGFFQSPSAGDGPVKLCPRKRKHELDPEVEYITKETSYTDSELGNMYGSPPKKLKMETTDGVKEEIESLANERVGVSNGKLKRNLFLKSSELNEGIIGILNSEEKVDADGDDIQDKMLRDEENTYTNKEEISSNLKSSNLKTSESWLETLEPESPKSPLKNIETNVVKENVSSSSTVVENSLPKSPILGSRYKSNPFAKLSQSTSVSPKVSGGILSGVFSKTAGLNKTPEGKRVVVKSRFFASNIVSPKEKVEETTKAEEDGNQCSVDECTIPCENVEEKNSENSPETIEDIAKSYSKVEAKILNLPVKSCVEKVQSSPRRLRNPFPQDCGSPKSSTVLENDSLEDGKNLSISLRKPLFNWGSLQEKFSCPSSQAKEERNAELDPSLPDNEKVKPKDIIKNYSTPSPVPTSTRGRGRGNNCRRPGLIRASTPKTKLLSQGSDIQQSLLSRFGFKKK